MELQDNKTLTETLDELQEAKALNAAQSQQISELIQRFSDLEKMHAETLEKLEELSKEGTLSKAIQASVHETETVSAQAKKSVNDFITRLVKASQQKSKLALKLSMKSLRVDHFLSVLSTHLKNFSEKLGQLEQKIQGLGLEGSHPKVEVEKTAQVEKEVEISETKEKVVARPRIRVGERRPEFGVPQRKEGKKAQKIESDVNPDVSKVAVKAKAEKEKKEEQEKSTALVLPEDFRSILEEGAIFIDHISQRADEQGQSIYTYRVNQKVEITGVRIEKHEGETEIAPLLKADFINRLMDGRLSVDQYFSEEEQNQMVSAYAKQSSQPNAFEKRLDQVEKEKQEKQASKTVSYEHEASKTKVR